MARDNFDVAAQEPDIVFVDIPRLGQLADAFGGFGSGQKTKKVAVFTENGNVVSFPYRQKLEVSPDTPNSQIAQGLRALGSAVIVRLKASDLVEENMPSISPDLPVKANNIVELPQYTRVEPQLKSQAGLNATA